MNTKYFKTVCIIMIVVSILGLTSGISVVASGALSGFNVVFAMLCNAVMLAAGLIGNKAAKDGGGDKAPLCRKMSYVLLALTVVSTAISLITSRNTPTAGVNPSLVTGFAIIGSIVSLILPVLYFLGARKLGE